MKLYSYYRSTAAYRIRIALNYKNLPFDVIPVDLLHKQQHSENYHQINPQQRVPTLIDDNHHIGQSMAILEYIEEKYSQPTLLPEDINLRAQIRYFAQIIVADIHPLNNVGILIYLKEKLQQNKEAVNTWYHHWLKVGFDALEEMLNKNNNAAKFCFGDQVTFADICLIPQIYNAFRFNFDMSQYPRLSEINDYCLSLPNFDKARPENQPDYRQKSNVVVS